MPQKDSIDFHPPRESRSGWLLVPIASALALAAGWWFWWLPAHPPAPATGPAGQTSESAATNAPAAAPQRA